MSHAGMQPVEAPAVHDGNGRYVAKNFPFTMAGDWILTVEATLPTGERAEHRFDLKGVSGGMAGDMPMTTRTIDTPMSRPTSAGR
jgi:hypothetical protein